MIGFKETYDAKQPPKVDVPGIAEALFDAAGPLAADFGLEHRPQQAHMALCAAQAYMANQPLLYEAGTGVGKSLAYLVPAIIQAHANSRQALVSTHTIALQEQLMGKDIPLCREIFKRNKDLADYAEFKACVLIGRANYVCTRRLAHAIKQKHELFEDAVSRDLHLIREELAAGASGTLESFSRKPGMDAWEMVNADSSVCSNKHCTPDTCPYRKARRKADAADILIVNHSLLFALMGAGVAPVGNTPGILRAQDFAILDEGHKVPQVATEHLGLSVSRIGIERLFKRIYNGRDRKGMLKGVGGKQHDFETVAELGMLAQILFEQVEGHVLRNRDIVRVRESGFADTELCAGMDAFHGRLGALENRLDEESPQKAEIADIRSLIKRYSMGLREFLDPADADTVYWAERTGRTRTNVTLRSAPVDISEELRRRLFERHTSVLVTSATLAEGPDMQSFAHKIGAIGQWNEQAGSPFDYRANMRVLVATDAPQPAHNDEAMAKFRAYLADMAGHCALAVKGGTLVLFNSYADLRATAEKLRPRFEKAGRTLLTQGEGIPRTELVRQMKETGNAILFGTDSFFTGVDVPGPALSQVIITRLPFENPSHPVLEARAEKLQNEGRNPFLEMTLPEAVVKFRQGVGRLIRKADDKGIITILDSRILQKQYGKTFLDTLPVSNWQHLNRANRDGLF